MAKFSPAPGKMRRLRAPFASAGRRVFNVIGVPSSGRPIVQLAALPRAASNDANALQLTRGGVATGIVAIPNRYMHSPVEVVSLTDLENAAKLIARFCLSLTPECDFTPR